MQAVSSRTLQKKDIKKRYCVMSFKIEATGQEEASEKSFSKAESFLRNQKDVASSLIVFMHPWVLMTRKAQQSPVELLISL